MANDSGIVNACDVVIQLDNAAGNLQDISGSSNEVAFAFDAEVAEYTTFGGKWKGRLCCRKDGSVSLNAWYSTTANQAKDILQEWWDVDPCTSRTLEVYIPDNSAGADKWHGEFILIHWDFTASSSDAGPIAIAADFAPQGGIHHTVVAS